MAAEYITLPAAVGSVFIAKADKFPAAVLAGEAVGLLTPAAVPEDVAAPVRTERLFSTARHLFQCGSAVFADAFGIIHILQPCLRDGCNFIAEAE